MLKVIVVFHNFANAPKKTRKNILSSYEGNILDIRKVIEKD